MPPGEGPDTEAEVEVSGPAREGREPEHGGEGRGRTENLARCPRLERPARRVGVLSPFPTFLSTRPGRRTSVWSLTGASKGPQIKAPNIIKS